MLCITRHPYLLFHGESRGKRRPRPTVYACRAAKHGMRFGAFAALCSFRCLLPPVFAAARSTLFMQRHLFTLHQHVFRTLKKFQPAHVSETRFVILTTPISSFLFANTELLTCLIRQQLPWSNLCSAGLSVLSFFSWNLQLRTFNTTQICICWTSCFRVSSLCNILHQRLLWGPTLRRPGNLQHVSFRLLFSEPLSS